MNVPRQAALLIISILLLGPFTQTAPPIHAEPSPPEGVKIVKVGTRLVSVYNIDLIENSYYLDFYLWFNWTRTDFEANEVQDFEFINGEPDCKMIIEPYNKTVSLDDFPTDQIQYRVRGEFLKTLDFRRYPFESHTLSVKIEHCELDNTTLLFVPAEGSKIEPSADIVGWNISEFKTYCTTHTLDNNCMSNYVFEFTVERPFFSSFAKNVLPLVFIVLIAMLTFLMEPANYDSRIGLAISSLLSASAIHLSLITAYPSAGYMTLSDGIMIGVYAIFLYILFVSVWIMKLYRQKREEDAFKFNSLSFKLLVALIVAMIALQVASF